MWCWGLKKDLDSVYVFLPSDMETKRIAERTCNDQEQPSINALFCKLSVQCNISFNQMANIVKHWGIWNISEVHLSQCSRVQCWDKLALVISTLPFSDKLNKRSSVSHYALVKDNWKWYLQTALLHFGWLSWAGLCQARQSQAKPSQARSGLS